MRLRESSALEVLAVFLRLGLSSFGGPVAHLGYFRRELVERRAWVSDAQFAQLVAISQFLPGPASSQLGFALGLLRAGWPGAVAAFVGFTLPSVLLMFAFAVLLPSITGNVALDALHGLKIVALAVVAHGVLSMTRRLCPDAARMSIAAVAAVLVLLGSAAWVQLAVVLAGGVAGLVACRGLTAGSALELPVAYGRRTGAGLLATFVVLLVGLPLLAAPGLVALATAFYRAGALVFGGGHVVLPLLEELVVAPGWITQDAFLAGYGAAQAVPGPMFSLAAYLGAHLPGQVPVAGAAVASVAIFLPGFLLIAGVFPFWREVARRPRSAQAIAGINAAVVGLLAAALYDPVFTSAVRSPADLAIGLVAFTLLVAWRVPALGVVLWCVLARIGWGLA